MSANGPFGNQPDDAGAFAVPDNLDWENVGFADEDNTRPQTPTPAPVQPPAQAPQPPVAPAPVRPTLPPAQPAPAAPATPAPQPVQPAAPAPHPGMPVGPYTPPAQPVQPPAPTPAAPTPPAPAPVMPSAPQPYVPPAQPPVQPPPVAQPPVPQYVAPQPPVQQYVAPEPTYAPAPQVSTTPAYTHAASAELEDLAEPEWARIGPVEVSESEITFAGDDETAFGDIGMPVQQAPAFDPNTGKRKKGRAPKPAGKERNPAREQKKGQYAGGRWTIIAIRGLVFLVAAVLLAGGVKNVVAGDDTATPAELAAAVKAELGYTGFPTEAAEAFAVRFTREYLTFDESADDDGRTTRLATYSPEAITGDWGWEGDGKQDVITGPFVALPTKPNDEHYATIAVTAQVKTGEWLSLAVPVYANNTGALVIAGPPAFIAQPRLAEEPVRDNVMDEDDDTAAVLTEKVFPGFLSAWAASNTTELDRYITPDATVEARTGLLGAVAYASVDEVKIPVGDDTRKGTVKVRWSTEKSGTFSQTYNVVIVKNADGNWSVKDISGGNLD